MRGAEKQSQILPVTPEPHYFSPASESPVLWVAHESCPLFLCQYKWHQAEHTRWGNCFHSPLWHCDTRSGIPVRPRHVNKPLSGWPAELHGLHCLAICLLLLSHLDHRETQLSILILNQPPNSAVQAQSALFATNCEAIYTQPFPASFSPMHFTTMFPSILNSFYLNQDI